MEKITNTSFSHYYSTNSVKLELKPECRNTDGFDMQSFISDTTDLNKMKEEFFNVWLPQIIRKYKDDKVADSLSSYSLNDLHLISIQGEKCLDINGFSMSFTLSSEGKITQMDEPRQRYYIGYDFEFMKEKYSFGIIITSVSSNEITYISQTLANYKDIIKSIRDSYIENYSLTSDRIAIYSFDYILYLDNDIVLEKIKGTNTYRLSVFEKTRPIEVSKNDLDDILEYKKQHLSEEDFMIIQMMLETIN